jgi:cobalt/nickel transport system permease protein
MNQQGFIGNNIAGLTSLLESVMLNEEISHRKGFLQLLDPRIKVVSAIVLIVIAGLSRNIFTLIFLFTLIIVVIIWTRVPVVFFIKRILIFMPVFTLVIAIPALFITPGEPLLRLLDKVVITEQGVRTAEFLFLRVTNSISLGVLLILTTRWTHLLAALRWFRIPSLLVEITGMTYRYIFLFLHTTNSMFLARRSRTLGLLSDDEYRYWLVRALGMSLLRTQRLSEEVYLAMISRGYHGEIRVIWDFTPNAKDLLFAICVAAIAGLFLWAGLKF